MTALTGLRVVELANERISFAGKLLADMGAEVILVEPPNGDPSRTYPPFLEDNPSQSLYFWHYNTNKKGVVLDLDTDAD
ncbi:MAG: crotonobetainyl-CoA:carnitine CoA-transferase CaiB-like acyl-CoA transferase, partial [Candidatus Azotimanducaceae bacterium]